MDGQQVLSQRLGEITHTRTHILLELESPVEERAHVDVQERVCYDLAPGPGFTVSRWGRSFNTAMKFFASAKERKAGDACKAYVEIMKPG